MQPRNKHLFASPYRTKTECVRLPFVQGLRQIALIADKHPQPEVFLQDLEKVAREMAGADGVNLLGDLLNVESN